MTSLENIGQSKLLPLLLGEKVSNILDEMGVNPRDFFEHSTPNTQCNNVIGKCNIRTDSKPCPGNKNDGKGPKQGVNKCCCWICGLPITETAGTNPLGPQCEHILPVVQANLILGALYSADGEKIGYTKDFEKTFEHEYRWSHTVCNNVKRSRMFVMREPNSKSPDNSIIVPDKMMMAKTLSQIIGFGPDGRKSTVRQKTVQKSFFEPEIKTWQKNQGIPDGPGVKPAWIKERVENMSEIMEPIIDIWQRDNDEGRAGLGLLSGVTIANSTARIYLEGKAKFKDILKQSSQLATELENAKNMTISDTSEESSDNTILNRIATLGTPSLSYNSIAYAPFIPNKIMVRFVNKLIDNTSLEDVATLRGSDGFVNNIFNNTNVPDDERSSVNANIFYNNKDIRNYNLVTKKLIDNIIKKTNVITPGARDHIINQLQWYILELYVFLFYVNHIEMVKKICDEYRDGVDARGRQTGPGWEDKKLTYSLKYLEQQRIFCRDFILNIPKYFIKLITEGDIFNDILFPKNPRVTSSVKFETLDFIDKCRYTIDELKTNLQLPSREYLREDKKGSRAPVDEPTSDEFASMGKGLSDTPLDFEEQLEPKEEKDLNILEPIFSQVKSESNDSLAEQISTGAIGGDIKTGAENLIEYKKALFALSNSPRETSPEELEATQQKRDDAYKRLSEDANKAGIAAVKAVASGDVDMGDFNAAEALLSIPETESLKKRSRDEEQLSIPSKRRQPSTGGTRKNKYHGGRKKTRRNKTRRKIKKKLKKKTRKTKK